MTTMTSQQKSLPPSCEGITLVNNELTCVHKKPMVKKKNRQTGKWFWACKNQKGDGSCERYLDFDKEEEVKRLLPHEAAQTPSTQRRTTQYFPPTPSTEGRSESHAKSDGQDKETDLTRRALTPTRRITPSAESETAIASGSTTSGVLERKRPISPDALESSPSKKLQSGPRSRKDPAARILFPPTTDKRAAANESHTKGFNVAQPNENDTSYVVVEDKSGRKLSEGHVSSQTGDGGSGTSPHGVARVPLGDADSNRV